MSRDSKIEALADHIRELADDAEVCPMCLAQELAVSLKLLCDFHPGRSAQITGYTLSLFERHTPGRH